jgi:hypothetical protein
VTPSLLGGESPFFSLAGWLATDEQRESHKHLARFDALLQKYSGDLSLSRVERLVSPRAEVRIDGRESAVEWYQPEYHAAQT